MDSPICQQLRFTLKPYGTITVTPRRNCTRVVMRRSDIGTLHLSVPYGFPYLRLRDLLKDKAGELARLLAEPKGGLRYHDGWSYTFPEGVLTVRTDHSLPSQKLRIKPDGLSLHVTVAPDIDFASPASAKTISDCIKRGAAWVGQRVLLPLAEDKAHRLGFSGLTWEIATGNRTLGSCFASQRRIRLSRLLVFLPIELREFVICHELAHLTHRDHSPAFHNLCNIYCCGNEKKYISALKEWNWPVFR